MSMIHMIIFLCCWGSRISSKIPAVHYSVGGL